MAYHSNPLPSPIPRTGKKATEKIAPQVYALPGKFSPGKMFPPGKLSSGQLPVVHAMN